MPECWFLWKSGRGVESGGAWALRSGGTSQTILDRCHAERNVVLPNESVKRSASRPSPLYPLGGPIQNVLLSGSTEPLVWARVSTPCGSVTDPEISVDTTEISMSLFP